ncbi:3D-(3,5/4)-trihydroxycyclohexane-1,2-dione acylhydrolase (decyclizing) [Halomonas sp. EGI 63088]|uniref:3D-(3,5/4)-trihydroxycyclohexane-1,2-dione acylhydrolase (Decyclizing) n=1 Tax=Halomonas flagellata TaxID=2920385 RepID=A0ABS9RZR1_9GAMM|nr:3D-(3,5/4)-trihydroxycyclohexane-1,2-dione acylhydrolase (decyclizing) [Halomonas flagellata]MCH4565332.1 3D-(3,5/4)-trihydroxycyclohexane-1,2-dione acylhydrolase (decyclizing) [Halomonas flagellata]
MDTVRLTMAQALVRYLMAQRIEVDGQELPLFPGVYGIFGHGNVSCLSEALEAVKEDFPTWRGQNEQSMGLAGAAFTKARRRRQVMVTTTSVGPGATNLVTAAGLAHANRLPMLMLCGDIFVSRQPDPVLQQVEHFHDPSISVNDAFKSVTRYWDRVVKPEQLLTTLPHVVETLLDSAACGPAFLALPQDVQSEAYDYPAAFFATRVHRIDRLRPDTARLAEAADLLRSAKKPLLVSGGGVHYSLATETLARFAERHGVPVTETVAGRGALIHDHESNVGPIGVIGSSSANDLAAEADVVLAVGTRLQDFTTGSGTVFQNPDVRIIGLNTARFDAGKRNALALVGDAQVGLEELNEALDDWAAPAAWQQQARAAYGRWNEILVGRAAGHPDQALPSYAQVVHTINEVADASDLVMTASGGLPGELSKNWKVKQVGTFDCEFGFSCMGYEIAGGWGAAMADPDRDVIVFVGDGAYMMLNSDIYSSVMTGHKMIVMLCDNGGYAIINRLQQAKGVPEFNNLLKDCKRTNDARVDFVKHAESMGAAAEKVRGLDELKDAFARAKSSDRTYVIVIESDQYDWSPGDAWWEVGTPEVSELETVRKARSEHNAGKARQRQGGY